VPVTIALVIPLLQCGREATETGIPDGAAADGEADGKAHDAETGTDSTTVPADAAPVPDGALPTCKTQFDCYNGGTCQDGVCCNGFYSNGECTCGDGGACPPSEICCPNPAIPIPGPCISAFNQCN
jgi:hypothetical protein